MRSAWYTVGIPNGRHVCLWPLRAPELPVSTVARERFGGSSSETEAFGFAMFPSSRVSPYVRQVLRPEYRWGPLSVELLRGRCRNSLTTSDLPFFALHPTPPPTETPQGVSGPQGPSTMESFLAGVGLVFIPWEQPVVPRAASPSPVVLVDFSLLASPTQLHAQTSLLGY